MNLSSQQLRSAAVLKEKILSLEKKLGQLLGSLAKSVAQVAPKRKFKMSAAGRARISAAAKARWAKVKGRKLPVKSAPKTKRKMNPAAKAKLSAKMKAIWAKRKATK